MSNVIERNILPPSTPDMVQVVKKVERLAGEKEQINIDTEHIIHGGIYTRTICVPAGAMITGALIKIATTLTISGYCQVLIGDNEEITVSGFMVIPASAGRKQVFMAITDTYISMCFKTDVTTIEEAEEQFTNDVALLKSRVNINNVIITGE